MKIDILPNGDNSMKTYNVIIRAGILLGAALLILAVASISLPVGAAELCPMGLCAGEKVKLLDDCKRRTGDIYNPGHGRRLQFRDRNRQLICYIERSGKITDKWRKMVGIIEGLDIGK